ncbi:MAG: hypothetical protein D3919_07365 [Candidatus Electrothrix sp. AW5]|nr:hypothetical protein [Candidatus Electrothrix gigas]
MTRTNPWLERSTKNLLALSHATDFITAQREWQFEGDVIDHEFPTETCELCEHKELRYHYKIYNSETENQLWVGSSCILRFQEIYIYDVEGNSITETSERKKELERVFRKKIENKMLNPLRNLWKDKESYRKEIVSSVDHFKKNRAFLPKQLSLLFSWLNEEQIEYQAEIFPIYLRSNESKEQLYSMQKSKLNLIKNSLSESQFKKHSILFDPL